LSAADLHLVVMGDPFVGVVHPCKIYNILQVGSPLLYIGPHPSHISEILQALDGKLPCVWAKHGDVDRVMEHIRSQPGMVRPNVERVVPLAGIFSKATLLPQLVAVLEAGQ
jgi:hypothetical protein